MGTFIWKVGASYDVTSGAIWTTDKGTFLRVVVKPSSRGDDLVSEIGEDAVHINLKGPAREGKANTELVKRLAKCLGVSTASISLVAGHKSRDKTLVVSGMSREEVLSKLSDVV